MKTEEWTGAISPWTRWSNCGEGWDTAVRSTPHGFLILELVDMGEVGQIVQFVALVKGRQHELHQERTLSERLTRAGAVRVGLRWFRGLVTTEPLTGGSV